MSPKPDTEIRAKIFLSYSTKDTVLAEKLLKTILEVEAFPEDTLASEGDGIRCFYAPLSIKPTREWELEIEVNINRTDIFLLLYTGESSQSEGVRTEVELASKSNKEIWVVRDTGAAITPFFNETFFAKWQAFSFHAGEEERCFEQVKAQIDMVFPNHAPRGEILPNNCPYPGPQPFSEKFAKVFFGRREAIVQLKSAIYGDKRVCLVYGPSGAGKTSLLTVGLGRELRPRFFYSDPIMGTDAEELFRQLLGRLPGTGEAASRVSRRALGQEIWEAINKADPNYYVLCFDQMENFFTENASIEKIDGFLGPMQDLLKRRGKTVTILISFRKESLADVQPHLKNYFENNFDERILRKLSPEDAEECMTQPASLSGVDFDSEVANALVGALAKDEGSGFPIVNPMDIQKVSVKLWEQISRLEGGPYSIIDRQRLEVVARNIKCDLDGAETLQELANRYVKRVLADFLREKVKEIADSLSAESVGSNREEFVWLSLMEFVGDQNARLRVPEKRDGTGVGKLSLDVVKKLVDSGLVQDSGNKQYELVHDSLAVEIAGEARDRSKFVFAVKSLNSVLSDKEKMGFNQHSELLENLEPVRRNKWNFDDDETEFLVRSALGDKRRNVKGNAIDLKEWAVMLAGKSQERFVQVLEEGLSSADESVQLDVMDLLLQPEVAARINNDALNKKLGDKLRQVALSKKLNEVKVRACRLLAALRSETGITELFRSFREERTRAGAQALALTLHALESLQGTSAAFQTQWKSLTGWSQLMVLWNLWRWRWSESIFWSSIIVILSTAATAIGATAPFIPLGYFGASLTIEDRDLGAVAGIFHGLTGGLTWGFFAAVSVLAYCTIWRGGRIHKRTSETISLSLWTMIGGFIGGVLLALLIIGVFVDTGLVRGGWLEPMSHHGRFYQALWETRHFWIMPVFGAGLGIGIGWSLSRILSDPKERWLLDEATSSSTPEAWTVPAAKHHLRRIVNGVLRQSWRNIVWLAVAALVLFLLLCPGSGVCDPAAHLNRDLPDGCQLKYALPPVWIRTAGLGFIILGGSLLMEVGFLFSLLTLESGFDIRNNLKENPFFLRSGEAPTGNTSK